MQRVWLGVWVAALGLLGCDAETRIVLLEPVESGRELDASGPVSPPQLDSGSGERDAGSPPEPRPDAGPTTPEDSGLPPVANPDAGSPTSPAEDALVLRYDFSGSGDVVPDPIADRDARLFGGTLLHPDRTHIT